MKPIVLKNAEAMEIAHEGKTRLYRPIRFPQKYIPHRYNGIYNNGAHLFAWGARVGGALYDGEYEIKAPYKAGDILWAREKWRTLDYGHIDGFWSASIQYADGEIGPRVRWVDNDPSGSIYQRTGWRTPSSMPKEATRILMKVALVGVDLAPGRDRAEWVWVVDFSRLIREGKQWIGEFEKKEEAL